MDSDDVLKADLEKARAECERLREENANLRLRVGDHHVSTTSKPPAAATNQPSNPSARNRKN